MLEPSDHALALWDFLTREWDRLQIAPTTWCRNHGIPDPTVLRWRHGVEPDVRNLRRVADALGRSFLDILVAAKYITPAEANGHVPQPVITDAREAIRLDRSISPSLAEAMLQLMDAFTLVESGRARSVRAATNARGTRTRTKP